MKKIVKKIEKKIVENLVDKIRAFGDEGIHQQ